MLNLGDLNLFVAFSRLKTLSKLAGEFYISQPTVTRTMKRVEASFGVSLFTRSSNQIELNETGRKTAEYAAELLKKAHDTVSQVQDFDRYLHTIIIESCAPAPLWILLPALSRKHPCKSISSSLCSGDKIIEDITAGRCSIGILPYAVNMENIHCRRLMEEHLAVYVPQNYDLAKHKSVTCDMLNGFNFLLASDIGFWSEVCRRKMPAAKFLVQTDEFEFNKLIRESSLPCFTTDLVPERRKDDLNRIVIPIYR